MTEQRRIELTEFINDNLAWECDPEMIGDVVDLIETEAKRYTLHIAEKAISYVGTNKKFQTRIEAGAQSETLRAVLSRIKKLTGAE